MTTTNKDKVMNAITNGTSFYEDNNEQQFDLYSFIVVQNQVCPVTVETHRVGAPLYALSVNEEEDLYINFEQPINDTLFTWTEDGHAGTSEVLNAAVDAYNVSVPQENQITFSHFTPDIGPSLIELALDDLNPWTDNTIEDTENIIAALQLSNGQTAVVIEDTYQVFTVNHAGDREIYLVERLSNINMPVFNDEASLARSAVTYNLLADAQGQALTISKTFIASSITDLDTRPLDVIKQDARRDRVMGLMALIIKYKRQTNEGPLMVLDRYDNFNPVPIKMVLQLENSMVVVPTEGISRNAYPFTELVLGFDGELHLTTMIDFVPKYNPTIDDLLTTPDSTTTEFNSGLTPEQQQYAIVSYTILN